MEIVEEENSKYLVFLSIVSYLNVIIWNFLSKFYTDFRASFYL